MDDGWGIRGSRNHDFDAATTRTHDFAKNLPLSTATKFQLATSSASVSGASSLSSALDCLKASSTARCRPCAVHSMWKNGVFWPLSLAGSAPSSPSTGLGSVSERWAACCSNRPSFNITEAASVVMPRMLRTARPNESRVFSSVFSNTSALARSLKRVIRSYDFSPSLDMTRHQIRNYGLRISPFLRFTDFNRVLWKSVNTVYGFTDYGFTEFVIS